MGKGKHNKQQRTSEAENVKIEEPNFSIETKKLSPAERKLLAQKERERKDEEDAARLEKQKAEAQKKNKTKTKTKTQNKKSEEPVKDDYNYERSPEKNTIEKEPDYNKRKETTSLPNTRTIRPSNNYNQNYRYNFNDGKNDKDFQACIHNKKKLNGRIREEIGDLFDAPQDYSLAHCVAEDFNMGAGIAKEFKAQFRSVSQLLDQNAGTGGLAFLERDSRFIYYLVTKKYSRSKPTLYTLWQSLLKLREHIVANNVTKLAIPQIGCGLDRLNWDQVQHMLDYIFNDVDIDIVVYILEYNANETPKPSKPLNKCFVTHETYDLVQIQPGTGLIFLGTADGSITSEIQSLAGKHDFLNRYKNMQKAPGDVVKIIVGNEYIYGLILRPNLRCQINFGVFEKCLHNLQKLLNADKTRYIGIQAFVENDDEVITDKIVNLMQYYLRDVDIWVCWPQKLEHLCPIKK